MFNPEASKEQLRKDNPAFDAACRRVEEEKQKYLEPIVEYFHRIEQEILDMPVATSFRRDRNPDFSLSSGVFNPILSDLNEADFKKAQLRIDLVSVRQDAMILIGKVESLIMDIEATKTEG